MVCVTFFRPVDLVEGKGRGGAKQFKRNSGGLLTARRAVNVLIDFVRKFVPGTERRNCLAERKTKNI